MDAVTGVNLRDPAAVIALLESASNAILTSPRRDRSIVRLPARGRLLATGDLHDNPIHLAKLVRLARLPASPDHHVVLHEMIHGANLLNGMDFSHRMLCRVAELVLKHPGQVHPVLANHELAQLMGKGVSKGAGNSVALFDAALDYVFGAKWEEVSAAIKRFIRAMPIAVVGGAPGQAVFCAHSLPAPRAMGKFDPGILQRDLSEEDYRGPLGSAYLMVWGREHTDQQVDELAQRWGVRLFCLGHEHVETGIEARGSKRIVLNSDHEFAAALPIDLAQIPGSEEALMAAISLRAMTVEEER